MMKATFRVKDDWRTMVKLEKRYEDGSQSAVKDTADEVVTIIRKSWSSIAPSNPYSEPAKVSHNLDRSIKAEKQGRSLGRFAGKDAKVWYVHFDTEDGGDNAGRGQYAMALEEGEERGTRGIYRAPRPFIRPALEKAGPMLILNIKRRLK